MMNINKIIKLIKKMVKNYELPLAESLYNKGATPFMILIAGLLSSRTKDKTTANACKRLFNKIKKSSDIKNFSVRQIEELIKPVGFYKNKAKYIKNLENLEKVPQNIEELLKIKGVGRKVANLVLSVAFKKDVICVDTHVHRITNRLGIVKTKTPKQTEVKLMKILPKKYWKEINHLLVLFGQNICTPIKPRCNICLLKDCPSRNIKTQNS